MDPVSGASGGDQDNLSLASLILSRGRVREPFGLDRQVVRLVAEGMRAFAQAVRSIALDRGVVARRLKPSARLESESAAPARRSERAIRPRARVIRSIALDLSMFAGPQRLSATAYCHAARSVRTAISGSQLMRTGTYTVPIPLLTNIAVLSRMPIPATTGNFRAATGPITGNTT